MKCFLMLRTEVFPSSRFLVEKFLSNEIPKNPSNSSIARIIFASTPGHLHVICIDALNSL